MTQKRKTGFTLMELLIVVIIVGILASVAMPQFNRMTRRARSAEATGIVGAILTAEWIAFQENQVFTAFAGNDVIPVALGVQVPLNAATNFQYVAVAGPPCVVTATADNTPAGGAAGVAGITVTGTLNNDGTRTVVTAGL